MWILDFVNSQDGLSAGLIEFGLDVGELPRQRVHTSQKIFANQEGVTQYFRPPVIRQQLLLFLDADLGCREQINEGLFRCSLNLFPEDSLLLCSATVIRLKQKIEIRKYILDLETLTNHNLYRHINMGFLWL